MSRDGRILNRARENAGLSTEEMGNLVGLEPAHVEALESGAQEASTDLLDRYARVFGLNLRRFLAEDTEQAPGALLFRSLRPLPGTLEDQSVQMWTGCVVIPSRG